MESSHGRERPHRLPPGIGSATLEGDRFEPKDHFLGFSQAFDEALKNIGRAPGRYRVQLELSATVQVENPGVVIEYIATII
ncbi:MAG TPA: hypothetical protein VFL60_05040 [Gaiellaceae bacterium]|nr:hypothetical protein [Gaiellaceae bacterium]